MALKDRICTTLGNVKTNFGCATPQTGYKGRVCTAINATYSALGCGGGITPPSGLPSGSDCTLSRECQSGNCEYERCT